MNIVEQHEHAHSSFRAAVAAITAKNGVACSGAPLPQQIAALENATAALNNPTLAAEVKRLNNLVADLQSKLSVQQENQSDLLDAREIVAGLADGGISLTRGMKREHVSRALSARIVSETSRRAVEIASRQGVPFAADADTDKSNASTAEAKAGLRGVEAVESHYRSTLGIK